MPASGVSEDCPEPPTFTEPVIPRVSCGRQNRYKEADADGAVNSALWVSPPFMGRSSSICCLPLVRAMVKVCKIDERLVIVNFTFSPGVRLTVDGSKKKLSALTVISLTPEGGVVGEAEVGVNVAVAAGRDVGVGDSEEPHAAASRPMVARRAIAKICFDNLTSLENAGLAIIPEHLLRMVSLDC